MNRASRAEVDVSGAKFRAVTSAARRRAVVRAEMAEQRASNLGVPQFRGNGWFLLFMNYEKGIGFFVAVRPKPFDVSSPDQ